MEIRHRIHYLNNDEKALLLYLLHKKINAGYMDICLWLWVKYTAPIAGSVVERAIDAYGDYFVLPGKKHPQYHLITLSWSGLQYAGPHKD